MTKRELDGRMANMIYRMTGKRYYLGDIDIVLEAFPYVIAEAIIEDETVSITGFGKFMPKHLHARDWTNPITGETKHV
ncbi:MAG: HU family DNA-binding protein [Coprobacillus sp.]|nr:HU family DNA-binding protein [Coprobacillus sp.]